MVRYEAGEIRRWRAENSGPEGGGAKPTRPIAELQKTKKVRASTRTPRPDNLVLAVANGGPEVTKAVLADGPHRKCARRGKSGGFVRRRCPIVNNHGKTSQQASRQPEAHRDDQPSAKP
jgi:hypothetical protein